MVFKMATIKLYSANCHKRTFLRKLYFAIPKYLCKHLTHSVIHCSGIYFHQHFSTILFIFKIKCFSSILKWSQLFTWEFQCKTRGWTFHAWTCDNPRHDLQSHYIPCVNAYTWWKHIFNGLKIGLCANKFMGKGWSWPADGRKLFIWAK